MATAKSDKGTLLGAASTEGESYAPTDTEDTAAVTASVAELAAPASTTDSAELSAALPVATATIIEAADTAQVEVEPAVETPSATTPASSLDITAEAVQADAAATTKVAYTATAPTQAAEATTTSSNPKLMVKYLDGLVKEVGYGTDGAAGIDLRACMQGCKSRGTRLMAGITTMFHTGIAVAIPDGYVGLIIMRSGKSAKEGILLANQVAVIDSDYRGEVMLPLTTNRSSGAFIGNGERVAQLVIVPCTRVDIVRTDDIGSSTIGQLLGYLEIKSADQLELTVVEELPATDRGDGGFGSTGSV